METGSRSLVHSAAFAESRDGRDVDLEGLGNVLRIGLLQPSFSPSTVANSASVAELIALSRWAAQYYAGDSTLSS